MCGIAGVFGHSDTDTVRRMIARLHHRGPDDSHVVAGENFTLGAARLSIQDLAHGRQPVTDESGHIVAVQNGEIYNYPELRTRLLKNGHCLATHCDTEALPHLYEEAGTALPVQLDGMFALAVWDGHNQTGILARDRTGKKPLYLFSADDGALWFASEIKALLEVPGFSREVNPAAVHHYLGYKHVPNPLSIFRGITALPPATRLRWEPGHPPLIEPYWRASWAPSAKIDVADEEALATRLLDLLRAGVRRRLLSDVPVGFFLSGGIDSSLTVALAAEVSSQPVKTFTLTYAHEASTAGKQADARWARWTAQRFGTEHHEETLHYSDFPSNLRRILTHFDEPFAGVVSTYFLSQLIANHVKVAVSGDGADELFGSYLSHRMSAAVGTAPPDSATTVEFDAATVARLRVTEDWRWRAQLLVFSDEEKQSLYAPEFREQLGAVRTDEHLRDTAFAGLTARDPLNRILEAEFKTLFPDQVLAFTDRLSMAHSLEVRTAFLDTAFVEFAAALPAGLKIRNGITKYLLKKSASRYFPSEMVHRKKEGFLMPITQWLLRDLQPYVRDVLAPDCVRRAGVFDPARVTALVDRLYTASVADHRQVNQVYALLVFHEWHRLYFN